MARRGWSKVARGYHGAGARRAGRVEPLAKWKTQITTGAGARRAGEGSRDGGYIEPQPLVSGL